MTLVDFAHTAGRAFAATLDRDEQRSMGQFMTPPAIAIFMARRLVTGITDEHVKVLEPAAGAGILAAAIVEELLAKEERPSRIELMVCELDSRLIATLERLGDRIRAVCDEVGVEFDFLIQEGDFLLSEMAVRGHALPNLLIISNPPYFKITKNDLRSVTHAYAVYGQPNIYGLFMAACARLVGAGGRWCFITPRSWMNGPYFAAVRRTIFAHVRPDALHAFESRKEHFEEDAVLQEAVITCAIGRVEVEPTMHVFVTRSQGIGDLHDGVVQALEMARLIDGGQHHSMALPTDAADPFEAWTDTLATLKLRVSTGPVVAFRATNFVREDAAQGTVPLLWMQHVTHNRIRWPIHKKREHILAVAGAAWMLVPNTPMVVMRRFSPKEDQRRITAAAYEGQLAAGAIGLENHLNYISRPGGQMTPHEVRGLTAFLNSSLVDIHFRARAGSTQVNATELRKLTFPPLAQLLAIGMKIKETATLAETDAVVELILGVNATSAAVCQN